MRSVVRRAPRLARHLTSLSLLCALASTPTLASAESALRWRGQTPLSTSRAGQAGARAELAALRPHVQPELNWSALSRHSIGGGQQVQRWAASYRGLWLLDRTASQRLDGTHQLAVQSPARVRLPSSVRPKLDAARARQLLQARTPFPLSADRMQLALYPHPGGEVSLVYVAFPEVPAALPSSPRLILDAHSGELIRVEDQARAAHAHVYATNPVTAPTLSREPLPIDEAIPGTLEAPELKSRNCVDRKTVKQLGAGLYSLAVHVCDLEQSNTLNAQGDYAPTPIDDGTDASHEDAFSQLSMFYHAGRALHFFRTLQGDPSAEVVANGQLLAVANLRMPQGLDFGGNVDPGVAGDPNLPLLPFDNAFFSPKQPGAFDIFGQLFGTAGGGIYFGQGALRDYAYDGDVVYHEVTHAVVDKTARIGSYALDAFGTSAAPGAINEALADYFAAALSGDPRIGEYAAQSASAGGESVIRDISRDYDCDALVGLSHADSLLLSTALWKTREALPSGERTALDQALYGAILSYAGSSEPSFEAFSQALLDEVAAELPTAEAPLRAALAATGAAPACRRVRTQEGEQPVTPAGDPAYGYHAPGPQDVGVRVVPGVVQIARALPEAARGARVVLDSATGSLDELQIHVKYDDDLRWNVGRTPSSNADEQLPLAFGSEGPTAMLTVPPGARRVTVQLVNRGDSMMYRSLSVRLDTEDAGESPVPRPTTPPDDAALDPALQLGGGCHQAPRGAEGALTATLLALAAVLGLRRRRTPR